MFQGAVATIRANRRAYIAINLMFYGLVACGSLIAGFCPVVQEKMLASLHAQLGTSALLGPVSRAYQSGNVPVAALLTFMVNSVFGAFAQITMPAAVIPFAGFLTGLLRPLAWGLMLAPTKTQMTLKMLPHSIVLLLEGQAYVLAVFGGFLWGDWFLYPARGGFATWKQGYRAGFRANVQLYKLILAVLAVSAV